METLNKQILNMFTVSLDTANEGNVLLLLSYADGINSEYVHSFLEEHYKKPEHAEVLLEPVLNCHNLFIRVIVTPYDEVTVTLCKKPEDSSNPNDYKSLDSKSFCINDY